MSSVLAVVVSYHPTSEIVENIKSLLHEVSHVVVVDNESSEQSRNLLSLFSKDDVMCIFNDGNNGVAQGFNQGIRWGLENNYGYFLLMDQDSRPVSGMVAKLLEVSESFLKRNQLIIVGPHHEDFDRKIPSFEREEVSLAPLLITSGTLVSKKVIDAIGIYDERLFIDHVDHDYCLRLVKNGGQALKVNSATLLHRFGEARVKTVLGKSFFVQDYTPFRRYYMMRNRIVLYKRYGVFNGEWFWLDCKNALKDIVKLILFEDNKKTKISAFIRGITDGLRWRDF